MLDLDNGIAAAEQIDLVRSYAKRNSRLGDVRAVDLIFDAIRGLMGDSHRLSKECLFSLRY